MKSNSKTKRKAGGRKKTPGTAQPRSIASEVYGLVKNRSFQAHHTVAGTAEDVVIYPKNEFAEKIVVSTRQVAEGAEIAMYRIKGGEKLITLHFVSDGGVRNHIAAMQVIRMEVRRFC